jgi:general secretion pathway protein D
MGQSDDLSERRQAEHLLAQAKEAISQGNLDLAESLVDRAERLDVKYDQLFAHWRNTPAKVRKEIERKRTAGSSTDSRPSSRMLPLPSLKRSSEADSTRPDPFQGRGLPGLLDSSAETNKAAAMKYLERARAALQSNNLTAAIGMYHMALKQNAQFGPSEDSPQRLAADLQQRGIALSQLTPVGTTRRSAYAYPEDPSAVGASVADRFGPSRPVASPVERQPQVINNPYSTAPPSDRPNIRQAPRVSPEPRRLQATEPREIGSTRTSAYLSPESEQGHRASAARISDNQPRPVHSEQTQRALALLAQARVALDRGEIDAAYQFAVQADRMNVSETEFSGHSPSMMLMHIERLRQRRHSGVVHASAVVPADGSAGTDSRTDRYPEAHSVYNPASDRTRNVPAQLSDETSARQPSTAPEAGPSDPQQLLREGEKALTAGDRERARSLLRQAWQFEGQLDAVTHQRLQDLLQTLELSARPPRPLNSPLEEVDARQQVLMTQIYAEVTREHTAADRMRETDPYGALQRLQGLRQRVARSELDPPQMRQLINNVDRAIDATQRFIDTNRHEIELDERNDAVRAAVHREQEYDLECQNKLAEITDEFNVLMDQQRWEEAELLARQARELASEHEVVRVMTLQSKFARRFATNWALQQEKEEAVYTTLHSVERSAIPFNDDQPYLMPNLRDWSILTDSRRRRLNEQSQRLTEAELQIREALKQEVEVRFSDRPLAEVMDTLGKAAGINVLIDQTGLHAEGVTSNTPVTLNLMHPISLRSALNHILQPMALSYVIQDEVLKITSEQTREADTFTKVYDVADLVIPIPNFVPNYEIGLPGAIRAAYNDIGYGQRPLGGGNMPLALLANNQQNSLPQDASVLSQIMAAGGNSMSGTRAPQPVGFGPGGLGGASQADFDTLIELITSTIAPTTWVDAGGTGAIDGFETNLSLVVSQTQEVHEEIVDLLEQLRRLQDLQVTIEVRFVTLQDNFFERVGVDFDFEIDDNVAQVAGAAFPDDVGPAITFGLDPTGAPTVDLDLPFDQGSFGTTVPAFGGFDASTAANFGFAILSDIEAFVLIQTAQGDTRSNIMQAPKVTLFNGQQAFVSDTSQRPFVTSVVPVVGDFAAAHQPVIVVLSEGTSLSVQAVVSPDRRFVRLTLVPFFSQIGNVETFTFDGEVSSNTGNVVVDPTDEEVSVRNNEQGRRVGTTVQLPTFAFVTVTTTVSVPDGGTVLLGGIKRLSEGRDERGVPMVSKIPYINRLFRNVGIGRQAQSLMMMVTPRIIIQEEEEEKLGIPSPS